MHLDLSIIDKPRFQYHNPGNANFRVALICFSTCQLWQVSVAFQIGEPALY